MGNLSQHLREAWHLLTVSHEMLSEGERTFLRARQRESYAIKARHFRKVGGIAVLISIVAIYILTPSPIREIQLPTHALLAFVLLCEALWRKWQGNDNPYLAVLFYLIAMAGYALIIGTAFRSTPPNEAVVMLTAIFTIFTVTSIMTYQLMGGSVIAMSLLQFILGLVAFGQNPHIHLANFGIFLALIDILALCFYYAALYQNIYQACAEFALQRMLVTEERSKLNVLVRDLAVAREVQASFVQLEEYQTADGDRIIAFQKRTQPLSHAWHTVRSLPSGETVILLAAATTRGVSAALVLHALKALWAVNLESQVFDAPAWLNEANKSLLALGRRREHSMSAGIVILKKEKITYYSAGHCPLAVVPKSKGQHPPTVNFLLASGHKLGVKDDLDLIPSEIDFRSQSVASLLLTTKEMFDISSIDPKAPVIKIAQILSDGELVADPLIAIEHDHLAVWVRHAA